MVLKAKKGWRAQLRARLSSISSQPTSPDETMLHILDNMASSMWGTEYVYSAHIQVEIILKSGHEHRSKPIKM